MKQEIITVFGKRYKAVAKFSNKEADMIEIEPLSEIDELKVKIDSLESKIGEINSKLDTFTMLNDKLAVRNAQLEAKIKELNAGLSDPKIYQQIGLTALYNDLETAKSELENLENEYFEVLEISEGFGA